MLAVLLHHFGILNKHLIESLFPDDEVVRSMTVPPSLLDPLEEQKAIMSYLDKYNSYNITVLCFTDPGDGVQSKPVQVTTHEDGKDLFKNSCVVENC